MADEPRVRGFPFATAFAALAGLFLFFGLMMYFQHSPNPLGGAKREPAVEPVEKLDAVRARNQAVLDGYDPTVKYSVDQSTAAILEQTAKTKDAKNPHGRLPFPVEAKSP
jgi:hypothetical protein